MAKILMLEKFKGELNDNFTAVYIATDVNMEKFKSYNLELKQVGDKVFNDIKNTKWTKISDIEYSSFKEKLTCVSSKNYLATNEKPKHQVKKKRGKSI